MWWLFLVLAIVFALAWGALHGLIVPRIGDLRPNLENRLTQALGVPVRIGSITAQSQSLIPSFELLDVRLLDSTGRDALLLKKVTAALSPRSLAHMGFEQLVIDQPELDIRRDAQGKIFVAGLDMSASPSDDQNQSGAADWFFSQQEFVIRSGTVHWTDELRGAEPLSLTQVDLVMRNPGRQHLFRLDATPATSWGERFSVMGQTRTPLLSSKAGRWRDWDGELFVDFTRIDMSQLKRYADVGIDITRGGGALRAWATLTQGQITAATADMALTGVDVRLARDLLPIAMQSVSGRLAGQTLAGGIRVATEGLAFRTQDGIQWPGGNVSYLQTGQEGKVQAYGELKADRLDLAALAQIADRLPLGTATHAAMRGLAPQGLVRTLQASWQGHITAPRSYEAQGRVEGLGNAAQQGNGTLPVNSTRSLADVVTATLPAIGRPGLRGATVDFKLNQSGGEAKVSIAKGSLDLPGFFEESLVPLDSLSADAKWTLSGEKIDLKLDRIKFANADAEGEAQAHWTTADAGKSRSKSRFPGVLDLQGSLSRGEGTRVHRYLPLGIAKPARDYVREAVVQGRVSAAKFKVKGDLFDMPFHDPKLGEFRIAAQLNGVEFAYVPKLFQPADSLPWPALTQVNGELVIDRSSLEVNAASGRMGSNNSLQIVRADARIPDLGNSTTVLVNADTRGALTDVLGLVNTTPLSQITSQSLAKATATGNADIKLRLNLPIKNIDRSKVAGTITLADNDVRIIPDAPMIANAKGQVTFNETGFAIKDAQARMLGGDVRLEGGTRSGAGPDDVGMLFRAQGTASAEGLRQAKELGFVSRLAQNATGSAPYTATLGFRRSVPEISVTSTLQGMGLNFPPPMAKSADSVLALRYENTLVRESLAAGRPLQDQISVDLGSIASIVYVRDISSPEPRVLRGGIGVGLSQGETTPSTEDAVVANINFAQVNMDAWQKVLSSAAGASIAPATSVTTATSATNPPAVSGYLPSVIAVRARELTLDGRTLNNVVVGGSREGLTWRANLDARELNGYMEYRQASSTNAGRLYARLARLNIAQSAATEIEATLSEQPTTIPALDIVVEDMELRGKKLGRVEVEAINRGGGSIPAREGVVREWRLNKLNVIVPEAQFAATGNWAAAGGSATTAKAGERRRTLMNFKLDITDSGELLKRLGMEKAIAKGKGKMEGQIAWSGSPLAFDYPSMTGSFNINIEDGQFLKADPGLAKLLGVLSLQSLPRRLTLDFRDVFSEGFSFDFVRGDVKIEQGVAMTNNLQMKGVNAAVLMEGSSDIAKGTQNIKAVIVPEINAGTASLVAAVINPAIGLGTFLAQLLLRKPLLAAATQEFQIQGTWADPKITKVERKPAVSTTPQSEGTQ
jgi:uncharacterized protein (TIGR02099 family)